MVKLIGMLLIVSSLLAVAAGYSIKMKYGSSVEITGNAISNIITQPKISMGFYDYIAGIAFSYSIVSFMAGIVFLFVYDSKSI